MRSLKLLRKTLCSSHCILSFAALERVRYFKKSRDFLKSTLQNHVISKKLGNLPPSHLRHGRPGQLPKLCGVAQPVRTLLLVCIHKQPQLSHFLQQRLIDTEVVVYGATHDFQCCSARWDEGVAGIAA